MPHRDHSLEDYPEAIRIFLVDQLGFVPPFTPTLKRFLRGKSPASILADENLRQELMSAATISHTSFFRHPAHFKKVRELIKELPAGRRLRIRVYAASTGEEVYSLASVLTEHSVPFRILASDIDSASIRTARIGEYQRMPSGERGRYLVPDSLRKNIQFRVSSIDEDLDDDNVYDWIFCRNMLIYFDRQRALRILNGISKLLVPEGVLFLSPVEGLLGRDAGFELGKPAGVLYAPSLGTSKTSPKVSQERKADTPTTRKERLSETDQALRRRSPNSDNKHLRSKPIARSRTQSPKEIFTPDRSPEANTEQTRHVLQNAAIALSAGEFNKARQLAHAHLHSHPHDGEGWFLLGEVFCALDEKRQAQPCFRKAAEHLDGGLRLAAQNRAEALEHGEL